MNTSGYIRGYMAKNMKPEDFIEVVYKALSTEFEEDELTLNMTEQEFTITLNDYKVILTKEFVQKYQTPYGIDRFILQEFEKQGFDFDINRSQYVQYCFGIYHGTIKLEL